LIMDYPTNRSGDPLKRYPSVNAVL
jgi:hypothetical protein